MLLVLHPKERIYGHESAWVSMSQHESAWVSMSQHESAWVIMSHHESWFFLCPSPVLTKPTHCGIYSTVCFILVELEIASFVMFMLGEKVFVKLHLCRKKSLRQTEHAHFLCQVVCVWTFALELLYCCSFRHVCTLLTSPACISFVNWQATALQTEPSAEPLVSEVSWIHNPQVLCMHVCPPDVCTYVPYPRIQIGVWAMQTRQCGGCLKSIEIWESFSRTHLPQHYGPRT